MDDFSRYERKISFMKKSTKIILPALALLVLGTTAAATSTVAWFAANGTVSATGMQVQCATSKNLIISVDDTHIPKLINGVYVIFLSLNPLLTLPIRPYSISFLCIKCFIY